MLFLQGKGLLHQHKRCCNCSSQMNLQKRRDIEDHRYASYNISRGGHSNRLCTNTRDRGQELGQAVKAENLEGQAVKGTSQIRKSQGSSTVKVNRIQNLIKARYHTFNSVKSKAYLSDGQAVKALN